MRIMQNYLKKWTEQSISGELIPESDALRILSDERIPLLSLLQSAYEVREEFCGKDVSIHILNNAQNGSCPEDCHYCVQSEPSDADIDGYGMKPDAEILAEAKRAYEHGAFRYCMVFSGRGPSMKRVERMAGLIKDIKKNYPVQVCLSAGLIDDEKAEVLKAAGLDRLNHNLNSSEAHYEKICTTHTFEDRMNTLRAAQKAGLEMCSGVIVGLGESHEDLIDVALRLRELDVPSIPVNLFMPIEGAVLDKAPVDLTPEFCLRVLCMFRFLNPKAEIRVAAGREMHLRSMEAMALYPANSLFLEGYLNTKGAEARRVYQMIKDLGFTIQSTKELDELLAYKSDDARDGREIEAPFPQFVLKKDSDLRPLKDAVAS